MLSRGVGGVWSRYAAWVKWVPSSLVTFGIQNGLIGIDKAITDVS